MPTQSTIDISELDNILLIIGENMGESMIDGSRFTRQMKLRRLALAQDWATDILADDLRVSLLSYSTIDLVSGTDELMPNQVDRDFSGASAWANVDIDAYDETGDLTITATAADQYCTLVAASAPTTIGKRYRMTFDVANIVDEWTIKDFSGTQTIGTVTANGTGQIIEWTAGTAGGYRIIANGTTSSADFDNFTLTYANEYELSAATRGLLDYINSLRIKYDADGEYYTATKVSETEMQRMLEDYAIEDIDHDDDSVIATSKNPVYCVSEGVRDDASSNKIFSFKIKILPQPDEAVTDGIKIVHYNLPELIGYPQNDDETSFSLHRKCVRLLIQYATAELKRVDDDDQAGREWEAKTMRTAKELNDLYRGKVTGNQKLVARVYPHF